MVTSLSKLCDLTLCKKCSVSSQELTPFLMWFLWLFKRRLNPVSLLPMYCSLHVLHSMMYITQDDWQSREWNVVKILLLLVLLNVFVSFILLYQLHFGLWQGLQPLGMRALSVVPFLNFVLTSLSLRLFGLLYAISGGLLNISANRSFDWRKFQLRFATSAINVAWGLYVVTRGIRSMGCRSL